MSFIRTKSILLFSLMIFIGSCMAPTEEGMISFKGLDLGSKNPGAQGTNDATVSNVSIVSDQLVINGTELGDITSVRVTGPSGFDQTFAIESKNATSIIANGLSNVAFAMSGLFNLILTDANGAATFQVTFTLQNGAVAANHLSSMGATTGQVLKYNGTTWVPSDLGGLTYAGNWNATTNIPNLLSGGNLGEYYIVSVAGSTDLSGGAGTDSWGAGDWVVWNDVLSRWEKVDNASSVTSFNGRSGTVTPATNDYTWAQVDKTTSSINDIANVNTTGATSGSVLKFDGTNWVVGTDDTTSAGSVDSTAIADDSIMNADINSAAAIDQSKIANLTTDLAAKLPLAGGTMTGDITMGSNNIITSGTVDGVDISTLNTTVSGKENTIAAGTSTQYYRGDKSWQTLNTAAVTESSNLYFTDTRARTAAVVNSTAGTETNQAPSVASMKSYVAANAGSGDFLANGTVAMTGDLNMGSRAIASATDISASGTITATTELQSGGGIKLGDDAGTCNGGKAGTFKYDGSTLYFCHSSEWKIVDLKSPNANLTISPATQIAMDITSGSSPGSYVTFTVTNDGYATSSSIITSLSNSTNFEIGTDNCNGSTLTVGSTCTIQVRPVATDNGSYSGNLTVTSNNTASSGMSGTASGFLPPHAFASLPGSTKRIAFVKIPGTTTLNSNADYKSFCETMGFTQNQNSSSNTDYTEASMRDTTNYYCTDHCCYLGTGNSKSDNLSSFTNNGLDLSTGYTVIDRGCGDYSSHSFANALNTTDTLTLTSSTTFTYNKTGNYGSSKSTTWTGNTVVVCQEN